MALAAVEAVKAIGEGSRRPQTAYRHHWVLTGLANKLFLKALWVGVDRGAEALDNWGLGRIKPRVPSAENVLEDHDVHQMEDFCSESSENVQCAP